MNNTINTAQIKANIETKLSRYFGCTPAEASKEQMYKAVAITVRDILTEKRGSFEKQVNRQKNRWNNGSFVIYCDLFLFPNCTTYCIIISEEKLYNVEELKGKTQTSLDRLSDTYIYEEKF